MRVLHLRDSGGLFGAERVILNIIRNKKINGLKHELCCMIENSKDSIKLLEEARLIKIDNSSLLVKNKFDLYSILVLRKKLLYSKIDIVHSHDFKSNFYSLMSTIGTKIKRVTTAHGSTLNRSLKFYSIIDTLFTLRFFHKIITVSPQLTEYYLKNKFNKNSVIEVLNGFDPSIFKDDSQNLAQKTSFDKLDNYSIKIGSIGRLYPEKGVDLLLKSIAQIRAVFPSIGLIIAGDGPEKKNLENMAKSLGIENNVYFVGNVEAIKDIYQFIDIFVLSSLREGLPNVILEAMYFEKPIISTSIGAIPFVLKDNEMAYLVPPGDISSLKMAIIKMLINMKHSKKMAKNAKKELLTNFTVEKMVEKIENIYTELLFNQRG